MCCRFYMEMTPELRPIVEAANRSKLTWRMIEKLARPLRTSGEIRPGDIAPAMATSRAGNRMAFPMLWGFQGKSGLMINARSETAGEKLLFREAWEAHRCALPASWYYEWEHFSMPDGRKKRGERFLIQPRGLEMYWLAGLYRIEEGIPRFTVLTRAAVPALREIHDRMPVIFSGEEMEKWIRPDQDPRSLVERALTDMVAERSDPA